MATTTRARSLGTITIVILGVLALLLIGDGIIGGPPTELDVTLRDYRFEPDPMAIAAGELVTMTFTNEDDVAHDISFGRGVEETDGRPVGYAEDLLQGVALDVDPRTALSSDALEHTTITVAPGTTVTLRMVLPEAREGPWEVGCFQTEGCHYVAGLHGELDVR